MADLRLSDIGGGGTPFGETSGRPLNPSVGQTYYNGTLGYLEIYTNSGWIPATGANDFSLNLSGTNTTITFAQSYSSGSYSIVSFGNDLTLDVYAYASDGSVAGYTNTKSFTATQRFNKMVILGGTAGDVLSFSYKTTYATSTSTSDITAGPYITSVTPTAMPNVNDTITVTGGNFATNIAAEFTGSGYSVTQAKSIVRSSSTSLIITRPDNFPISSAPYTLTIKNPSVANQPTGSNVHQITLGAGSSPVWVNSSGDNAITLTDTGWSYTFVATDVDGAVTYSIVTGTLPSGATFNSSTGVITSTNVLTSNLPLTVRVTDAGGNTANLSVNLLAPIATGGTITTSGVYKIHTFTGSGSLVTNFKGLVEILAVGGGGGGSNIIGGGGGAGGMLDTTTTLSTSGTFPVTIGAGGRGGYGYNAQGYEGSGAKGDNTTFNSQIAYGGGGASGWSALGTINSAALTALTSGGSGAGGSANSNTSGSYPVGQQVAGLGVSGQGNNGGVGGDDGGPNREIGGGGGGAGAAGTTGQNSTGNGGAGRSSSISGSAVTYAGGGGAGRRYQTSGNGPSSGGSGGGGGGGTGNGGGSNGSTNLGGGGGGGNYPGPGSSSIAGGTGGSGIFIVKYKVS